MLGKETNHSADWPCIIQSLQMTFYGEKDQEPRETSEKQASMDDFVKHAATGALDKYHDSAAAATKKKHANPFSVEYILSCDSSKKPTARNMPHVENKVQRDGVDFAYVNKSYSTLAYGQPPVSATTNDVETIGENNFFSKSSS